MEKQDAAAKETMNAAKLVAESVAALLDAAHHVAGCGGLEHASADYLLDCSRRVYCAIQEAENVATVDPLGEKGP